jgi:ABC-type glycerol-3-phosphate transport system permease component
LTLYNYIHIFIRADILHAGLISALRTLIGATLTVLGGSVFAYALSDPHSPARKVIYRISVVSMYLSAGLIPWYLTMRAYGLQNSFMLYVLPSTINVFYVMLIKTYFEQIAYELKEAAKIDGAGHFSILFQVILPVSIPILATIFIFAAVDSGTHGWTTFS